MNKFVQKENVSIYFDDFEQVMLLFQKASELSPEDPIFIHNTGWLYILKNDFIQGRLYLETALEKSPKDPILNISLGMLEEKEGHEEYANLLYAKAIALSPFLIETPFFKNLCNRISTEEILNTAEIILIDSLKKDNSYVLKSKLAKLYWSHGKEQEAKRILEEVTGEYPNMNRAWLMLGKLNEEINDSLALVYYNKSKLLDPQDELPYYYQAKFFFRKGDITQSNKLYNIALLMNKLNYTNYVIRSKQIYHAQIWENEYFPQQLLSWTTVRLLPVDKELL
ncbi:MAG TPA: tetratricopeptide repeat protein [Candidatus Avirikenella pullistercoris]|nr:tetratricopeptide repeat protein [Candidatus Avirikenella pullistercoris]